MSHLSPERARQIGTLGGAQVGRRAGFIRRRAYIEQGLDPYKAERIYQMGYQAAKKKFRREEKHGGALCATAVDAVPCLVPTGQLSHDGTR